MFGRASRWYRLAPALSAYNRRFLYRKLPTACIAYAGLRVKRGVLFSRLGNLARAIEELSEAARLLPRDLEVHLKLAFLLNATSQYERVIELLIPLEPHYPSEPDLLVFLGFASLKLGRNEAAAAYYERALHHRPNDQLLKAAFAQAHELARSGSKP